MDSLPEDVGGGPAAVLSRFRREFHACLTARADELAELADAVLCADDADREQGRCQVPPVLSVSDPGTPGDRRWR
jgi:hypothetical protein